MHRMNKHVPNKVAVEYRQYFYDLYIPTITSGVLEIPFRTDTSYDFRTEARPTAAAKVTVPVAIAIKMIKICPTQLASITVAPA